MMRNAQGSHTGRNHHRAVADDAMVEDARVLRDRGATYREIGERLGVSMWTARDWADYRTR